MPFDQVVLLSCGAYVAGQTVRDCLEWWNADELEQPHQDTPPKEPEKWLTDLSLAKGKVPKTAFVLGAASAAALAYCHPHRSQNLIFAMAMLGGTTAWLQAPKVFVGFEQSRCLL